MATTPVRITLPTSGLTATLVLYDQLNGTVLNTPADTLTQVGSTGTQYEANVTEAIAGLCYAEALSGTTVLALTDLGCLAKDGREWIWEDLAHRYRKAGCRLFAALRNCGSRSR